MTDDPEGLNYSGRFVGVFARDPCLNEGGGMLAPRSMTTIADGRWFRASPGSAASLARGPHRLRHFPQRGDVGAKGRGLVLLANADGAGALSELF